MRDVNWYTGSLMVIGILAPLWSFSSLDADRWVELLLILALVIYLDLFPIKLFSGDEYVAGTTIGILYILRELGLGASSLLIILSTLIAFVYRFGSFRYVKWSKYFTTIGMYLVSLNFTFFVIQFTREINLFLSILLSILTFELVNTLLLAGIFKSVMGVPIFQGFYIKLKELIIPVFVCMIVLSRLILTNDLKQFTFEIIYTVFFLAVIIFFSSHFMKQVHISQNATKKFIEVLETRIAPQLSGHGTRVGIISGGLAELIDYPKKHRHILIQVATIHDIGKSLLPSHLLQKRGALTLSEEKEYQSHSEKGAEIVQSIFSESSISKWILYHHERWDGKGFPKGLSQTEIPLEARVISLCNQLDYLMTRHNDDATVLELLKAMSGHQLDPHLIDKIDESFLSEMRESLPVVQFKPEHEDTIESISEINAKSYIGQSFFVRYENGQFYGFDKDFPAIKEIGHLANKCLKRNQPFHETINQGRETFEAHFNPNENQVLIFIHDITPMLLYREHLMKDTLESYRDIIFTLSEERIELDLEEPELSKHLGEAIGSFEVSTAMDVPESRKFVTNFIADYTPQFQSKILLAVSEAVTNTIKHSTGGKVHLYRKKQEDMIQVLVTDQGSGIPINEIPKTILVSGYSSKRSLGKGFLLIRKSADKTRIHTSPKGTSILMEFSYSKQHTGDRIA